MKKGAIDKLCDSNPISNYPSPT